MNIETQSRQLSYNIKLRNLLVLIVVISGVINILLSMSLLYSEQQTVILPCELSASFVIGARKFSPSYIEDISRDVISTILNRTSSNNDLINESVLKFVDSANYGRIKNQLMPLSDEIKKRKISTSFYPITIKADPDNLSVKILGELATYVGQTRTSYKKQIYRLGYNYSGGKLTLKEFLLEHSEELAK